MRPKDVDTIADFVQRRDSSGLNWNEEDKLKTDMMNRRSDGCQSPSST